MKRQRLFALSLRARSVFLGLLVCLFIVLHFGLLFTIIVTLLFLVFPRHLRVHGKQAPL